MQQRQAHQIILHKIPCGSKEVGEVKQKIWSSPKTSIKKRDPIEFWIRLHIYNIGFSVCLFVRV